MSGRRITWTQRLLRRLFVRGRGEVRAMEDAMHLEGVLRFAGLPDFPWFPVQMSPRHAMELHLAGREYSGEEGAQVRSKGLMARISQLWSGS